MRPKKKILVFCGNPDELGRVGFVLWTRHLKPVLASTVERALIATDDDEFDCAMVLVVKGCDPTAAEDAVLQLARARAGAADRVLCAGEGGDGAYAAGAGEAWRGHGGDDRDGSRAGRAETRATMDRPPRGYLPSNLQRVGQKTDWTGKPEWTTKAG